MATTSPNEPYTVQVAGLTNAQQQADKLPAYAMYADIPGAPNLRGPRSAGLSSVAPVVTDSEGFPLSSPQEPAAAPPVGTMFGRSRTFYFRPVKPMWEPSVYVPGKGWVNSSNA